MLFELLFFLFSLLIKVSQFQNQELNEPEKSNQLESNESLTTTKPVETNLKELIKTSRIISSTTGPVQVDKTTSVQFIHLHKQPIQYINFTVEYHKQKLSKKQKTF